MKVVSEPTSCRASSLSGLSDRREPSGRARTVFHDFEAHSGTMSRKIGEKWTALPIGAVDQSQVRQAASISNNSITTVGYPADMAVDSFDPASMRPNLTPVLLAELIVLADRLDQPGLGLDASAVRRTAMVARHGSVDWAAAAATMTDADLHALIRVFAKGENEVPGWEAGAKSPVIPLVRELKKRGTYPSELTIWIKANSENRFLPHGSLMDRLK